jgi:5-methylcytosine-specific restriction endonuclease McrA
VARTTVTRDRLRARLARTKPNCHICGKPIDYTLHWLDPGAYQADHIVPLSRGGANTIENLAASHRACNSTKRARPYAPIIRRSGALDQGE